MEYRVYNSTIGRRAKTQVYASCNGVEGFGSGLDLKEALIKATANLLNKMYKVKK